MTRSKKGHTTKNKETEYTDSAVARLRLISGLSQSKFAVLCAINPRSYKSLEKRQHENGCGLSRQNAYQIAAATGASPGNLMRNQLRLMGENRRYTHEDFEIHQRTFGIDAEDWKNQLINVAQGRYEEILDKLADLGGVQFLSTLFFLTMQIDRISKACDVTKDEAGAPLKSSISELAETVSEIVPDFTEQTLGDKWRRWRLEEFAVQIGKAEKAAREDRKKRSKKSKVAGVVSKK